MKNYLASEKNCLKSIIKQGGFQKDRVIQRFQKFVLRESLFRVGPIWRIRITTIQGFSRSYSRSVPAGLNPVYKIIYRNWMPTILRAPNKMTLHSSDSFCLWTALRHGGHRPSSDGLLRLSCQMQNRCLSVRRFILLGTLKLSAN